VGAFSVPRPTWPARLVVDETFSSVNYSFTYILQP
jgi:hypothetical protein